MVSHWLFRLSCLAFKYIKVMYLFTVSLSLTAPITPRPLRFALALRPGFQAPFATLLLRPRAVLLVRATFALLPLRFVLVLLVPSRELHPKFSSPFFVIDAMILTASNRSASVAFSSSRIDRQRVSAFSTSSRAARRRSFSRSLRSCKV